MMWTHGIPSPPLFSSLASGVYHARKPLMQCMKVTMILNCYIQYSNSSSSYWDKYEIITWVKQTHST